MMPCPSPDPPGWEPAPVRLPKAPLHLQAAAPGPLRVLQLPRDVAPVGVLRQAVGCSPKEPVPPRPRTPPICCPAGMWATPPPPAPSADLHAAPHAAKDPWPPDDDAEPVLSPAPELAHAQGRAAGVEAPAALLAAAAAPGEANGRVGPTTTLERCLFAWKQLAARVCSLLIL